VGLPVVRDAPRVLINEGGLIRRGAHIHVHTQQAATVAALRRLLTKAGHLLDAHERHARAETQIAIQA
jgi:hypothetical protein